MGLHVIEYHHTVDTGEVRTFSTGATRDTNTDKLEPWGFTSALVTKRFSEYMHEHRKQSDGELRDSDNWKKGIPFDVYKHSLSRHVEDLKLLLEGHPEEALEEDIETVLCSVLFNVQGMLHVLIKERLVRPVAIDSESFHEGWYPEGEY